MEAVSESDEAESGQEAAAEVTLKSLEKEIKKSRLDVLRQTDISADMCARGLRSTMMVRWVDSLERKKSRLDVLRYTGISAVMCARGLRSTMMVP